MLAVSSNSSLGINAELYASAFEIIIMVAITITNIFSITTVRILRYDAFHLLFVLSLRHARTSFENFS